MLSVSDIREEAFSAAYSRGRQLYEKGAVLDFSYDMYLSKETPFADITARVRGSHQNEYKVTATIDEDYEDICTYNCECEAFYNYDGLCKHCVAALLTYVNRRAPVEILRVKHGTLGEFKESSNPVKELKTAFALKNLLNQYSLKASSQYLLPESVYGRVELDPYFRMNYGYAQLEFKIGTDMKYVLKNISGFVESVKGNEKVRYGKKLDFYHHMDAFTEPARRMIRFLQQADGEKKRQSKSHAYYVYSNVIERTLELDTVGIDRFFEAVGDEPFHGSFGYSDSELYRVAEEIKKPELFLKAGASGIFLVMDPLSVIEGSQYYYVYSDGVITRLSPFLRQQIPDFFQLLNRQSNGSCYIAAEELPMFCRDMLPLLQEGFHVISEGFDESLYIPPKPEFEIYLDKQDQTTVMAKLVSVYGERKYNVLEKILPGEMRDVSEEFRIKKLTEPYFNGSDAAGTLLVLSKDEELLYQLIAGGLQRLSEHMAIYTSEGFRNMKVTPAPSVSVGVSLKSDLLELQIQTKELKPEELAYILSKYDRKKKYIRLKNGDFLDLSGDGIAALAEISQDLYLSESDIKKGTIVVPKYRAMYLDSALKNTQLLSVEKNRDFKGMVRNMKTIEDSDFEVPELLKDIMRSYQKDGYLWIKTLRENGFGGILADDMGLGKTLQVISFLLSEQQEAAAGEKEVRRSLIICPASLVYNWKKEMERFAPELSAVIVAGSAAERKSIISSSTDGQILITSYDLLKRDVKNYADIKFAVQVIDEAQYIKNAGTQAAKGVKQITASFKLALTGTPIENRLSELWSIFDYLMPGFLYSYQRFREEIETPIVVNQDENRMERLQRMIRPFILRRLKGDVLKDLPEKLEENVFAKLEGEQLSLYDAHVQQMMQMLNQTSDEEFNSKKIQILAELMKLRQLCCDPALLYEDYSGGSAKTDMCMELIENAVNGGHKVLLFSQFTTMLERLSKRLKKSGIPYYMLTGSVNKEKRMQMVESFDKDEVPVFCISLKAGGTGLNLTAADIVIHYDPWWNVAVQNQATDRAHRIGQEHIVTVYKLVTQGTIEEKMIDIQERKKMLAEQILGGEGMDSVSFTREELLEMLNVGRA